MSGDNRDAHRPGSRGRGHRRLGPRSTDTHDRSVGREAGLDDALDTLAAVGEREKRRLTEGSIDRMARAAARERATLDPPLDPLAGRSVVAGGWPDPIPSPPAADPPPTRLTLTGAGDDIRRSSRRRPVLAVAAAVLLVAVAGATLLSDPEQVVVTQEGAASEGVAPDEDDAEREARPVLDLGQSLTTTVVSTSVTPSAPVQPTTSTSVGPTTAETPASSVPPSSTSPAPVTSLPSNGQNNRPIERPLPNGWLRVEVGGAGAVALRLDDSVVEVGGVVPAPGWTPTVLEPRTGGIDVVLVDGPTQASLGVSSEPGRFLLEVDDGQSGRSQMEWITTYTIDDSGTVGITYNSQGLLSLDVQLVDGWEHHITTGSQDQLTVHIVNPDRRGRTDERVDAGPVTIDLVVTGP